VSKMDENEMRSKILAIMRDTTLTDAEKAKKRQELMCSRWTMPAEASPCKEEKANIKGKQAADTSNRAETGGSLDENLKCAICLNLCERPVTAPCQHNFCLGCFNKWVYQNKKTCPTCRAPFPAKFAQNPRINTALTFAIRLAKNPIKTDAGPAKEYKRIDNESRPEQAFVTERAQRAGRANAASGRIMVTIPNDHFGPIGSEHDPSRNQGVLVGEWWKDRLDCRQWGAHFPHVAGIAGQSNVGAQSVVLSGGYEDDKDEGEWFLYTGSGGRDLSGNKRTNKVQSFDQEFENMNKALKLSCIKGMPVRVVRSYKEKRSAYAPSEETPVRYDGIYRILRCWRKPGAQKHLICRYLFVRCDNSPAPWHSGENGDSVRLEVPKEAQDEIKQAKGEVFQMSGEPFWDWLEDKQAWGWAKPQPASQRIPGNSRPANPAKKIKQKLSEHEKALKEFSCGLCRKTLVNPLSTPCGHNFCKGCLDKKFEGITDIVAPNAARTLRIRKNQKPCPSCKADICDFLSTAQVNREMSAVITKLQEEVARAREQAEKLANQDAEGDEEGEEGDEEQDEAADEDEQEAADQDQDPEDGEQQEQAGPSRDKQPAEAMGNGADAEAAAQAGPSGTANAAGPSTGPSTSGAAAASVPAPAPAAAKDKYASELAALREDFPDFDEELIRGLLEDQGGDLQDVRVMLKKFQNQAKRAASPRKPAAGGKGKAKAKGAAKGKGKRKARSTDEDEEDNEGEGQAEEEEAAENKRSGGEQDKMVVDAAEGDKATDVGGSSGAEKGAEAGEDDSKNKGEGNSKKRAKRK